MTDSDGLINIVQLYEGNDGKGYYDKKKEKKDRKRQASIWIGLLIIMGSIFMFCVYRNIYDVILKKVGNSVTIPYTASQETAVLRNSTGGPIVINIGSAFNEYSGDKITLYYLGSDISKAQPVTPVKFWIFAEIFFGGSSGICSYFIYKALKVTKHSSKT